MCGIAGYMTTNPTERLKLALVALAYQMEERGGHSWGYMTDEATQKGLGSIVSGLTVPKSLPKSFALHTRYATTGARVAANSHPFTQVGSARTVTGVHNGIISNHATLNRDYRRKLAVDSQHIFQHIADGHSLNDLQGYGAIVYQHDGQWFIGRFNDGEMSVALTSAGVIFASTRDAVIDACSIAGIKMKRWIEVRNNSVYRMTTDGLTKAYKLDCGRTTRKWNDAKLTTTTTTTTTKTTTTPALASTRDWNDDDWRDHWRDQYDVTGRNALLDVCDYCGESDATLYHYDRDYVCADCYAELTDSLPAGFRPDDDRDFPAYKLASTTTRKQ